MIFDPNDCIVVVQTYPSGQCRPEILGAATSMGVPMEHIHSVSVRDIPTARNIAVRDWAFREDKGQLLMFDADMVPTSPATDRFWCAEGDIIGAHYKEAGGLHSWDGGAVHCGMMLVNMDVFRVLPAPWFEWDKSDDGCDIIGCECSHFIRTARAAGFTVTQAGYCLHERSPF